MFKIFGDVHSKGILVPGPPCTKIGDFLGKPLLVSTFFDLSEIWDPARILDAEQLCNLCWKTIWGLLHGQNCQKGFFENFLKKFFFRQMS